MCNEASKACAQHCSCRDVCCKDLAHSREMKQLINAGIEAVCSDWMVVRHSVLDLGAQEGFQPWGL